FIRNPSGVFLNSTISVFNANQFNNTGADVKWTPFDGFDNGSTDHHRIITFVDPLTGHARIIVGDDQGVYTTVDNNGTFSSGIGTDQVGTGARNGNLQITQFYYGAAQPSSAAAQVAGAMFYGQAQDDGFPRSDPSVLNDGNIGWSGSTG